MPHDLAVDKSTFVKVMIWCRQRPLWGLVGIFYPCCHFCVSWWHNSMGASFSYCIIMLPVDSPHIGQVIQSFDVFIFVGLNRFLCRFWDAIAHITTLNVLDGMSSGLCFFNLLITVWHIWHWIGVIWWLNSLVAYQPMYTPHNSCYICDTNIRFNHTYSAIHFWEYSHCRIISTLDCPPLRKSLLHQIQDRIIVW